jgi:hypothetical protein
VSAYDDYDSAWQRDNDRDVEDVLEAQENNARIAQLEAVAEAARYFFLQWDRHFAEHLDDFIEIALVDLRIALRALNPQDTERKGPCDEHPITASEWHG